MTGDFNFSSLKRPQCVCASSDSHQARIGARRIENAIQIIHGAKKQASEQQKFTSRLRYL